MSDIWFPSFSATAAREQGSPARSTPLLSPTPNLQCCYSTFARIGWASFPLRRPTYTMRTKREYTVAEVLAFDDNELSPTRPINRTLSSPTSATVTQHQKTNRRSSGPGWCEFNTKCPRGILIQCWSTTTWAVRMAPKPVSHFLWTLQISLQSCWTHYHHHHFNTIYSRSRSSPSPNSSRNLEIMRFHELEREGGRPACSPDISMTSGTDHKAMWAFWRPGRTCQTCSTCKASRFDCSSVSASDGHSFKSGSCVKEALERPSVTTRRATSSSLRRSGEPFVRWAKGISLLGRPLRNRCGDNGHSSRPFVKARHKQRAHGANLLQSQNAV